MATARDVIQDAYAEIGVYSPTETMDAADAQFGLRRFQSLLDAWLAEQFSLHLQTRLVYPITSGNNTFTIGPGGNVSTQRPTWIEGMNYINPGNMAPGNQTEVVMAPMSSDQYMALSIKGLVSGLPQEFYYNATVPLGTMVIWPVPSQTVSLVLYLEQGVDAPSTLNTVMQGPAGYAEAFLYQLSMRLCNAMGRPMPPTLPTMARNAFARMQRPNADPGIMGMDQAVAPVGGSAFNVLTGNYTGASNS